MKDSIQVTKDTTIENGYTPSHFKPKSNHTKGDAYMRCSVCGTYIPENQDYCTACGNAVKGQTVRMIRLICADCYGVMDIDLDKPMEKCPYCNSKRLLIKGDKTRFIKIKSLDDLKLDMMMPYSAMERVKIKQKLDDECDRRYYESAPAIKVNKKKRKHSNVDSDNFVAIIVAVVLFILAFILFL